MAISFLSPARSVLLISDDALYVYASGAGGAQLVEVVPWEAENFEQNVARILAKDCKSRPVLLLNDMVEQHYRKERVLKAGVSVMDRPGMLKRKLNVSFPNYPVRAAYPLKEKLPKTEKKGAADIYIFAALPNSQQLTQSIGVMRESMVSIAGLCLLPVESSNMVKALSAKLSKSKKGQSKWVIFMGQHKSGGLRQIVTKNGELALTRMTPVVDSDPQVWASQVQKELKATMSYLSRFGYHESEGLDIIVVGDEGACQSLNALIDTQYNFVSMNAREAARMLGLPFAKGADERYADSLHVSWAGRKGKFILPMNAPRLEAISKPRQMAMVGAMVLLLGAAFLGYQAFTMTQAVASASEAIVDGNSRYAQLDLQYQKELSRLQELGFDVKVLKSAIAVVDDLDKHNIDALGLFENIGRALGGDLRVDSVNIKRATPPVSGNVLAPQGNDAPEKLFDTMIQMTYPATTDIDKGNDEVRALGQRLQAVMPDYDVRVTKLLKDYEYVEQIVVESGDLDKQNTAQDFTAEITITGMVTKDD